MREMDSLPFVPGASVWYVARNGADRWIEVMPGV